MKKKINVQNDLESRRRIAEAFPKQENVLDNKKKEVVNAQGEEVSESPVIESTQEPETKKKGRRKAEGNA